MTQIATIWAKFHFLDLTSFLSDKEEAPSICTIIGEGGIELRAWQQYAKWALDALRHAHKCKSAHTCYVARSSKLGSVILMYKTTL